MRYDLAIIIKNDGRDVASGIFMAGGFTKEAIRLTALAINDYISAGVLRAPDAERCARSMLEAAGSNGILNETKKDICYAREHCEPLIVDIDIGTENVIFYVFDEWNPEYYASIHGKDALDQFMAHNSVTNIWDGFDQIPLYRFGDFRKFINTHPNGIAFQNKISGEWIIYQWI